MQKYENIKFCLNYFDCKIYYFMDARDFRRMVISDISNMAAKLFKLVILKKSVNFNLNTGI